MKKTYPSSVIDKKFREHTIMVEALENFCKRVEEGSIRSRVTYARFREILEEVNNGNNK